MVLHAFRLRAVRGGALGGIKADLPEKHSVITTFGQTQRVEGKKSCAVTGITESRHPGQSKLMVKGVHLACYCGTTTVQLQQGKHW